MLRRVRESWEKNWPEIHCGLRGGLPDFVVGSGSLPLGGVPIFYYHQVLPEEFRRDLEHLNRNGYRTLDSDTLLRVLDGRSPLPERGVVLTFDDGARNLHDTVHPLLRDYGLRGVAFVAPRFHEDWSWFPSRARPCSWEELLEVQHSGTLEIQSHTLEHRYLSRWPEPAPLRGVEGAPSLVGSTTPLSIEEDLRAARELLQERLGVPVHHLAFPKGDAPDEVLSLARSAGYSACWWTSLPGRPWNHPGSDPMHIVRVSGDFLRRLPGQGRISLPGALASRYRRALTREMGHSGSLGA